MRTCLPPPRMPNTNSRADHHMKAPYIDTCPQEARTCLSPSTTLKADPNAPFMNLLLSELLQIPQEPEGHQVLLDNSTPQMPAAAAAAAVADLPLSLQLISHVLLLLVLVVDGNKGHTASRQPAGDRTRRGPGAGASGALQQQQQ